jgi:hypothetical protein
VKALLEHRALLVVVEVGPGIRYAVGLAGVIQALVDVFGHRKQAECVADQGQGGHRVGDTGGAPGPHEQHRQQQQAEPTEQDRRQHPQAPLKFSIKPLHNKSREEGREKRRAGRRGEDAEMDSRVRTTKSIRKGRAEKVTTSRKKG